MTGRPLDRHIMSISCRHKVDRLYSTNSSWTLVSCWHTYLAWCFTSSSDVWWRQSVYNSSADAR